MTVLLAPLVVAFLSRSPAENYDSVAAAHDAAPTRLAQFLLLSLDGEPKACKGKFDPNITTKISHAFTMRGGCTWY